jgi:hypothetical protein
MPTETNRVIRRKQIALPNGGSVNIAVITQITFLDVVNQAQESEFHLENGAQGKRDVRVASVPGNGAATDETGVADGLKVERVDVWRVLDVVEQGQETFFHPDSKTVKEPPDAPPFFATHEKTHLVKYINTPDDGNWIKSELIDRWKYADTVEQGQETEYFLSNPPDGNVSGLTIGTDADGMTTIAVDLGIAEISDSANGIDPPWRTDPFQNIVDCKSGVPSVEPTPVAWLNIQASISVSPPTPAGSSDDHFVATTFWAPGEVSMLQIFVASLVDGHWPPASPPATLYGISMAGPDPQPLPPSRGSPPTYGNRNMQNNSASGNTCSGDVYTTELNASQSFYSHVTFDGSGIVFRNVFRDQLGNPNPSPNTFVVTGPPPGYSDTPGAVSAFVFLRKT